jgi:hypothetical protein
LRLKGGADLIGRKPSILKESRLLCTFRHARGAPHPEFSPADLGGGTHPIYRGVGDLLLDVEVGNALLPEFRANPDGPLASTRVMVHEGGHEPLVRDELFCPELLEDAVNRALIMALGGQLALELTRAVLTPSEESDRRDLDFLVGVSGGLG